jgi:hypothetical protein
MIAMSITQEIDGKEVGEAKGSQEDQVKETNQWRPPSKQ